MAKNKNRTIIDDDGIEKIVVEAPAEDASLWKKLNSSAYIMLHPELKKKAMLVSFFRAIGEAAISLAVFGVIVIELICFFYLKAHYGFIG